MHQREKPFEIIDRIEQLRTVRGWSIYELATHSELSDKAIYNWYNRKINPSYTTLSRICKGFGISLGQFFSQGNYVDVNKEVKELYDSWSALNLTQRNAIKVLIKSFHSEN